MTMQFDPATGDLIDSKTVNPTDFPDNGLVDTVDVSELFAQVQDSVSIGNILIVDAVYGDDTEGLPERLDKKYLTIEAALADAVSGDTVWILGSTYTLASGITIPTGVAVRGISLAAVKLQMTGVTADTTLVTMGENTRLEDVTLSLTSSQHHRLIGVKFPGTTSSTAKLRTTTLSVNNSGAGAGTSEVIGVLVESTGTPGREVSAIRATTITTTSTGSGRKRGLLVETSACNFFTRDVNYTVHGGTDAIAIEVNKAGAVVGIVTGVADGDTADVSQTAGSLELGQIDLIHSSANGKGFTATQISFSMVWADPGGLPGAGTRYYRPGSAAVTLTEIKLNVPRKAVIKKLHIRALSGPGGTRTDTWTVRKNGVDTLLTVSLTGAQTVASNDSVSVSFSANDDISLKVATDAATSTSDTVAVVEMY